MPPSPVAPPDGAMVSDGRCGGDSTTCCAAGVFLGRGRGSTDARLVGHEPGTISHGVYVLSPRRCPRRFPLRWWWAWVSAASRAAAGGRGGKRVFFARRRFRGGTSPGRRFRTHQQINLALSGFSYRLVIVLPISSYQQVLLGSAERPQAPEGGRRVELPSRVLMHPRSGIGLER